VLVAPLMLDRTRSLDEPTPSKDLDPIVLVSIPRMDVEVDEISAHSRAAKTQLVSLGSSPFLWNSSPALALEVFPFSERKIIPRLTKRDASRSPPAPVRNAMDGLCS
jgi:hypothetical protein